MHRSCNRDGCIIACLFQVVTLVQVSTLYNIRKLDFRECTPRSPNHACKLSLHTKGKNEVNEENQTQLSLERKKYIGQMV